MAIVLLASRDLALIVWSARFVQYPLADANDDSRRTWRYERNKEICDLMNDVLNLSVLSTDAGATVSKISSPRPCVTHVT